MAVSWKQFPFFDRELINDHSDPTSPPSWLKVLHPTPSTACNYSLVNSQDTEVTASASGKGHLFFGDKSGNIIVLNHYLSVVLNWSAHPNKVTNLIKLSAKNLLVSVGEDESGVPIVKVWNLDKLDKNTRNPVLSRSNKIQLGSRVFPVTTVAVLENMTQIAIGLENGVVVLLRGDISRDRFTRQKVVHEGSESVTVTMNQIIACNTSGKETKTVIDEQGGNYGCSFISQSEKNQEMIVGRKEAVYYFSPEGRGQCFVIESEKTHLSFFRNYLVVVSKQPKTKPTGVSLDDGFDSDQEAYGFDNQVQGTILTLYDVKSKYIAYTGTFGLFGDSSSLDSPGVPIKSVCNEGGELFVVTADSKMYRLEEKDLSSKLEYLFKKNLYPLALSIVTNNPTSIGPSHVESFDRDTLVEIHKRYGDWLYSKLDYDSAMQQYQHTIGHLEPSYVIRKYLDAQRIHNLTSYLQALHAQNLANTDHTTLLLNCYTKLKSHTLLSEFIKSSTPFDVETAIRVCRQSGYYEHALFLAQKFEYHHWYLKIQVDDLKQYEGTVKYLTRLNTRVVVKELLNYANVLVTECPSEMTDLIVRLCTPANSGTSVGGGSPIVGGKKTTPVVGTLSSFGEDGGVVQETAVIAEDAIADPLDFVHFYVDQPTWCLVFLERVLARRWPNGTSAKGGKNDIESVREEVAHRGVCNTLLELYLSEAKKDKEGTNGRKKKEEKTLALLKNPNSNYDVDQALVMCKVHGFRTGTLYLCEKANLHRDILMYQMEAEEYASVLETCKKYGDIDPTLWTEALTFFAAKATNTNTPSNETAKQYLSNLLDHIDSHEILPPLQVLQVLMRNPLVTVGMVRDYIINRVQNEKTALSSDER
ncbi:Vacuolar protein sorting-associated protein 11, partial [Nowakowskiella sp. JEL0407]